MTAADADNVVPVVIVGGGPVGSALAIELGLRGISTLVIERMREIDTSNPRGGNITMRTVEHYRRWGLSRALLDSAVKIAAGSAAVPSRGEKILYVASILGESMGVYDFDWGRTPAQAHHLAAECSASVNQPVSLRLQRQRAEALGARYLLGHEFLGLAQDEGGVDITLRDIDSGALKRLRAAYVYGADGAASPVRKAAGIAREGHTDELVRSVMCILRLTGTTNGALFSQLRYKMNGFLMVANGQIVSNASPVDDLRWRFTLGHQDAEREPTMAEVHDAAVALFGRDIGFEIETISSYRSHIRIAERYSRGRVFIGGDATHVFPPAGGHNQNLGIGDSVNLGWKLAAVLHGWGGPELLESYDPERRKIGWQTALHSFSNARNTDLARRRLVTALNGRNANELPKQEREALGRMVYETTYPQWHGQGVVLDIRYDDSPVIASDDSAAPRWQDDIYAPHIHAGHRAPHAWLGDGRALYDAFGPEFTLIDFGRADPAPLIAAFRAAGAPLTHLRFDDPDIAALYGSALALVRPDQQLAWHGDDGAGATAITDVVLGRRRRHEEDFQPDYDRLKYLADLAVA